MRDLCVNESGGFESSGGRRADGLKGDKQRDRRDFGDVVGGKVTASDDDDDRHRSSRGSRQPHKSTAAQQGECYQYIAGVSKSYYLSFLPFQGDHFSGKPGNVREFETCQR